MSAVTTLAKTRARYSQQIYTYEERKKKMRLKYKDKAEFEAKVANIDLKIILWKKQQQIIDNIANKIIALGNAVSLFTGYNVRNSKPSLSPLARCLFYKYGIENGIMAKYLMEYTGDKDTAKPNQYRRGFTNSFKNNPTNKHKWISFRAYMESLPVAVDDFIDQRRAPGS